MFGMACISSITSKISTCNLTLQMKIQFTRPNQYCDTGAYLWLNELWQVQSKRDVRYLWYYQLQSQMLQDICRDNDMEISCFNLV